MYGPPARRESDRLLAAPSSLLRRSVIPTGRQARTSLAQRMLYQRPDCRWAWRLKPDNGQIIATDGGQGYENEADARRMADRIIGGELADADKRILRNAHC